MSGIPLFSSGLSLGPEVPGATGERGLLTLLAQTEETPDGPLAYSEFIVANALSTIPALSSELGGSSR